MSGGPDRQLNKRGKFGKNVIKLSKLDCDVTRSVCRSRTKEGERRL